jgi:hypothetical protein
MPLLRSTVQKSLVEWASSFVCFLQEDIINQEHPNLFECFSRSVDTVDDDILHPILIEIKQKGEANGGVFPTGEFFKYPEVFDRLFVTILYYGHIYNEIHLVLDRFCNHPEEMKMPYYLEGVFEEDKDYRFVWREKPASWNEAYLPQEEREVKDTTNE